MDGPPQPLYEEWHQVILSPALSHVSRAVDRACRWLGERGATEEAIDAVRLGLSEAVTNAVKHGGATVSDAEVWLRWTWETEWGIFEVSEPGYFIPGPTWHELPEDPLAESGRGGFLMTQTFDELDHRWRPTHVAAAQKARFTSS